MAPIPPTLGTPRQSRGALDIRPHGPHTPDARDAPAKPWRPRQPPAWPPYPPRTGRPGNTAAPPTTEGPAPETAPSLLLGAPNRPPFHQPRPRPGTAVAR